MISMEQYKSEVGSRKTEVRSNLKIPSWEGFGGGFMQKPEVKSFGFTPLRPYAFTPLRPYAFTPLRLYAFTPLRPYALTP